MEEYDLTYKVKCRGCNEISEMFFGTTKSTNPETLGLWIDNHKTFPIERQCECDNGSMSLHDIISYTLRT